MRLSWNAWPASKSDAEEPVAPLGLLFQPMKKVDGLKTLAQPAVRCSHCRGVLNPHAHVEPHNRRWRCPLCSSWNSLPDRLLQMGGPPPEVLPELSVVEYDEEPPAAPGAAADSGRRRAGAPRPRHAVARRS